MSQVHYDILKLEKCHSRCLWFSAFASSIVAALCFFTTATQAKNGGWDLEPYHIQIAIVIDAPGGLAEQLARELPQYVERRVEASFAPAWICETRIAIGAERANIFSTITASD